MNKVIQEINEHLGDGISKKIFSQRLLYSLTEDSSYVRQMVLGITEGQTFYNLLDRARKTSDIVIFGAGIWGKDLYKVTKDYHWKCFVDSDPKVDAIEGVPVISFFDFMKAYRGETIVISSRLHNRNMYEQLVLNGVKTEKIIDAGHLLDELSRKQYFDLEELQPAKEEIFVDAGCFDGMTSVHFSNWCMKGGDTKSFVYAFEPDLHNVEKCHNNLLKCEIEHEIIGKGCWNEETTLHFQAIANGASSITSEGETDIEVTTLDKALKGKRVTFIKMDIEGAEIKALEGAKDTIIKSKPKLAISIYHDFADIWQIPQKILEYCSDYTFYLRHYSLTDYETVLYPLPYWICTIRIC